MAKNLNSVSFTVLLLVLVMASTAFLKSEAIDCPGGCSTPITRVFLGECEPAHGTTHNDCCICCVTKYGSPPVCWAAIEGTDEHCHCYTKAI
ncbi:defensin-like protein 206 [Eutrema salsugineum]|uniref:defensin-like protein 206 n=1 Tax=Eutrema salsugineum TaxID=72664 RepID=UPI000CED2153|nr:defensin-like protein 206 [Eutrema salsugineum]